MNFREWLENIRINPDNTVTIVNYNAVDIATWNKVSNYLQRKGYDVRGGEDVKNLFSKWVNHTYSGDQAEALKRAIAIPKQRAPRTPIQKMLTKAKIEFGITTNIIKAGYILPDGSMLDFSGARQGSTFAIKRSLDHRDINRIDNDSPGGTEGMQGFCVKTGAIRVGFPGDAFIDIYKEPTKKQLSALSASLLEIKRGHGQVSLELHGKNRQSFSYPQVDIRKILGDIERFYV